MLRVVAAVAALAIGATVVLAQNAAVIDQRKQAMKAFGGAAKGPGAMNKGDAAFELPKVQALNFVLYNALAGGASRSLRIDTQGKLLGVAILDLQLM